MKNDAAHVTHPVPCSRPKGTAQAIGRSLHIYYGDPAHAQAMDRMYAPLVRAGGLAFDIGAHVGDRIACFRRLGARVVALEPQPGAMRALRLLYGRDRQVTLVRAAAGERAGSIHLHVNSANPTVTTASRDFIQAAAGAPGWEGQLWDWRIVAPLCRLDDLIRAHGVPDFIKIDVEGLEDRVLAGLSHRVRALSFEFTTIQRELVSACAARLSALGDYRYNFALGETHRLVSPAWLGGRELGERIDALPPQANSGDIYAVLAPGPDLAGA